METWKAEGSNRLGEGQADAIPRKSRSNLTCLWSPWLFQAQKQEIKGKTCIIVVLGYQASLSYVSRCQDAVVGSFSLIKDNALGVLAGYEVQWVGKASSGNEVAPVLPPVTTVQNHWEDK